MFAEFVISWLDLGLIRYSKYRNEEEILGSQNIPYLFYFSEYAWRKFYHIYLYKCICTCTYKYVYVRAYLKNIDIFFFLYINLILCRATKRFI